MNESQQADLELALARWVLGAIAPEDVPTLATDALVQGCDARSVAVLAGMRAPTTAQVLDEPPALLSELDTSLPNVRDALKTHADAVARDIVAGELSARAGAWSIVHAFQAHDPSQEHWDQVGPFWVAYEYDELEFEGSPDGEIDAAIIVAAKSFLAAGGLHRVQG